MRKTNKHVWSRRYRWVSRVVFLVCTACAGGASPKAASALVSQRGPYEVEVLFDGYQKAPTYFHRGQHFVQGKQGARYVVRVHNRSSSRVEAVVSVDGRDVLDGKKASYRKRGYLIAPWGHVDIDGWRISNSAVAAFRFSSVPESYAAKTGDAWDVGVIGVAIFSEYAPPEPSYDATDEEAQLGAPSRQMRRAPSREMRDAPSPQARNAPSREMRESSSASTAGRHAGKSPRAMEGPATESAERPGLGTEFGEVRHSSVYKSSFERDARQPAVLGVRYNDRTGLIALGIDVDHTQEHRRRAENQLRMRAQPFRESHYAEPPPGWLD